MRNFIESRYYCPISTEFYDIYVELPNNTNCRIFTPIVSKNASSTLFSVVLENKGIKVNRDQYQDLGSLWNKLYEYGVKESELPENCKRVAVIRDPLERIASAYNTVGKDIDIDRYIEEVVQARTSLDETCINRHVANQFIQYNIDKIDLFVPIEVLDKYFESIGIKSDKINCSEECIKLSNPNLDEVLEKDYETYNNILNSDKCFRAK